jgi:S-adenosylmethionine decarboxylase
VPSGTRQDGFRRVETIESGTHILLDANNIKPVLLWDANFVRNAMILAAREVKAHILHDYFHHFGDAYGVTGIVAVSESHLSIHTWPEWSYASIDVFLCRGMDPMISARSLLKTFDTTDYKLQIISRKAVINKITP